MTEKKLLICTHGKFGEELLTSAQMIVGPLENVQAFSLMPEMSADEYASIIQEYLETIDQEAICLVDLFGGTPSNTVMRLSQDYDLNIVSGVNLPMLLEVYMNLNNQEGAELAELAVSTLVDSGKNISKMLKER